MQAANFSSFVSSEPKHSQPRQLRRVEPKRRTRENFHNDYGQQEAYRQRQPVQSRRAREPEQKKPPTPQKKTVVNEEDDDDDEGYSDEDFEDYGEDDFEDFEDEDTGTASSKTEEQTLQKNEKWKTQVGSQRDR